jgi:hypothetical protein
VSAPFKRGGTHRLECPACPFYVYATVAALEAHGLPACPCGETLEPARLELAELLGRDQSPAMIEFAREVSRVANGQARKTGYGHDLRAVLHAVNWRDPATIAAERVEAARTVAAQKRRLQALKPVSEPLPF